MAYKQKHKYGFRDSLEKGNPEKVIYGDYFDDEFEAIEQAIADIDPNSDGGVDIDEIDGLQEELDKKIEEAPNDGKQYVRESEAWAEVAIPDDTGIPEPPGDSKPYSRIRAAGRDDGSWTAAFSIEDASTDGEILHWDDSAKEWISNSSFTIEGAGINALLAVVDGSGAFYTSRGNGGGIYCSTGSVTPVYNKAPSDGEVDFGSSDNKWKDGYFSGAIDASQFTVNGAEIPTSEDIEYLDGRIDAIEGNISGGGGFVEAPDNGDDYARNGKSPAWVKTYNAEYIDALETDYKNADADKADKDHDHIIGDVTDLQAALDGKADADHNHEGDYAPADHNHEGDYAPADHNHEGDYAPADHNHEGDYAALNHTHTTDEIIGLDDKIDEIEDDITDLEGAVGSIAGQLAMGGSYDASTGLVVTANLSEFTSGQPLPDYSTVPNTFVIVSVAGDNPEELGEGDWLVAGQSGWVSIKYGTAGSVEWDNIQNVPSEFPPEAHNHDGLWEQNGSDIYYSDGNVGIGTDSPSGSQLHIKKAGNVISKIESEGTGWAYTEVKNTAGNWLFGMNSGSGGEFKIYDKKSAEDRLTIDSDGNVGIGDSDSSRKLSVVDSKSVVSRFESTGAIGGQISFSDSTTSDPDGVDVRIGSIGDELHAFTGNQSRLTIDNEGDATFSGSVFLQDQNARFFWNGTAGQTRLFSNGGLQIRTGGFTEPDTALTIDASGNVGIGTDSPGYPLHVFGDARFQESGIGGITIKIEDAAESGIGKARVGLHQHNAETDFFIGQTPDNNLGGSKPNATYNFYTHNFQTVGTTRLTIDNEGDATFSGVVEANRYIKAWFLSIKPTRMLVLSFLAQINQSRRGTQQTGPLLAVS